MYRYLFFDLDGTLTDPKEGITNSVAYALKYYGIHADPEDLIPFIGPPLHESFMRFYGFDREKAMEAVGKYREYFSDRGIWENALFPGVPELLAELRAQGRAIALATSKPEVFARQILDHFEIAEYFDAVCGSRLDGSRTRKAEVIETAHARLEQALGHPAPRAECVMIGDRLHDIEGARAAGMDSVGLTFGYGGARELREAGADYLADSFAQLLKRIE